MTSDDTSSEGRHDQSKQTERRHKLARITGWSLLWIAAIVAVNSGYAWHALVGVIVLAAGRDLWRRRQRDRQDVSRGSSAAQDNK